MSYETKKDAFVEDLLSDSNSGRPIEEEKIDDKDINDLMSDYVPSSIASVSCSSNCIDTENIKLNGSMPQ